MTPDDANPYLPPKDVPPTEEFVKGEPWKVDYFGGFSAAMQNPNWLTNAFLCGIIAWIPVLGNIVGLGYAFDIAETLHRTNGRTYPDFNFNRFSEYLVRGVGPFLVQFIVGMVCGIPFAAVMFGVIISTLAAAEGNPQKMNETLPFVQLGLQPLQIVLNVAVMTLAFPLMARSGISGEIGEAFKFDWGWQALARTWLACALMSLLWYLAATFFTLLGCLLLCIGFFPALGYIYGVQGWFGYQFYRLALSEGLPPIPLKTPPATAGPA